MLAAHRIDRIGQRQSPTSAIRRKKCTQIRRNLGKRPNTASLKVRYPSRSWQIDLDEVLVRHADAPPGYPYNGYITQLSFPTSRYPPRAAGNSESLIGPHRTTDG
jgi:hypothetical protein